MSAFSTSVSSSYTTRHDPTPSPNLAARQSTTFKEIFSNYTKFGETNHGNIEVDNGDLFCTSRVKRPVLVRQLSSPNLRKDYTSEKTLMSAREGVIWNCVATNLDTYGGRRYRYRLNDQFDHITNGDPDNVIESRLMTQIYASFPATEPTPTTVISDLEGLDDTILGKNWIALNPVLKRGGTAVRIIGRELGFSIEYTPWGVYLTLPDKEAIEARYQRIRSVLTKLHPLTILSVSKIADDHSYTFGLCVVDGIQAINEFIHDSADHIIGKLVQMFEQVIVGSFIHKELFSRTHETSSKTYPMYNFRCAKLIFQQYRNLEMMKQMACAKYTGTVAVQSGGKKIHYSFPTAYAKLEQTFTIIKILMSTFQDSFSGNITFQLIPREFDTTFFNHSYWGPYLAKRLNQEPPFGAKDMREFVSDLTQNVLNIRDAVRSFRRSIHPQVRLRPFVSLSGPESKRIRKR